MTKIYLQDVTLRDGMHAIRHRVDPQRLAAIVPTVRRLFGPDVQIFLVLEGLPAMARGSHAPVPPPATGKTLPRARIDAELVFLELAGGCFVTETDRPASTNGAIVKILEAIAEQPYQCGAGGTGVKASDRTDC